MATIKEFFKDEYIDDEWKCDSCKKTSRKVQKCLKISQAPNILIVQLKRFSIFPRKKKINDDMKYPEQLNIKNYCSNDVVNSMYRLKAMVLHSGSIDGGHYTALGKRRNGVFIQLNLI
jgi:ubiquitin C-terminal hydrolase